MGRSRIGWARVLLPPLAAVLLGAVGGARGSVGPKPGEVAPDAPAAGRFLVATRPVSGIFFESSVILLLDADADGALGLVVNRPTSTQLSEALPDLEVAKGQKHLVWVGGPVEPAGIRVLLRQPKPGKDAVTVIEGVQATGSLDALKEALRAHVPPERLRALAGYAGWAPGQLEEEIARGDWVVAPATAEDVFSPDPEGLWKRLLSQYEGMRVQLPSATDEGLAAGAGEGLVGGGAIRIAQGRVGLAQPPEALGLVAEGGLHPRPTLDLAAHLLLSPLEGRGIRQQERHVAAAGQLQ